MNYWSCKKGETMNALELIGPVMVGPSSSHTAGAVRIGQTAAMLLGEPPAYAELFLRGSFAETGRGHGTDRALIAGLLGLSQDDPRIPESFSLARERGLSFLFGTEELRQAHPNSVRILLRSASGKTVEMQAASIGGGSIQVTKLGEVPVEFSGRLDTLIAVHQDSVGIIARLTQILAAHGINIASLRCSRTGKGKNAVTTVEADGSITPMCLSECRKISQISRCDLIHRIEDC